MARGMTEREIVEVLRWHILRADSQRGGLWTRAATVLSADTAPSTSPFNSVASTQSATIDTLSRGPLPHRWQADEYEQPRASGAPGPTWRHP